MQVAKFGFESAAGRTRPAHAGGPPLPSSALILCETIQPAKGCSGHRHHGGCDSPTEFQRSGAASAAREGPGSRLGPAWAPGRRHRARARTPGPGRFLPPPPDHSGRRGRSSGRARGGAWEEPRPRRPGRRQVWMRRRCGAVRSRPCIPGAGTGAGGLGLPLPRSLASGFDLRTTWGTDPGGRLRVRRPEEKGERPGAGRRRPESGRGWRAGGMRPPRGGGWTAPPPSGRTRR